MAAQPPKTSSSPPPPAALASCWVGGDNPRNQQGIPRVLGVPEGHKLISLIAIGHTDTTPSSPPRHPLKEVLHWEKW